MGRRGKRRSFGEISAASMSDIAFLLLIFFLVTTIFALEKGIPMVLPGDTPPKKLKKSNMLIIQAHANGAITIDNSVVTLRQVRTGVERRLAENKKLIVVLETHPDSEYGLMVDLLDEVRLAQARRISLKQMGRSYGGP